MRPSRGPAYHSWNVGCTPAGHGVPIMSDIVRIYAACGLVHLGGTH
jgi:hypothetical protein